MNAMETSSPSQMNGQMPYEVSLSSLSGLSGLTHYLDKTPPHSESLEEITLVLPIDGGSGESPIPICILEDDAFSVSVSAKTVLQGEEGASLDSVPQDKGKGRLGLRATDPVSDAHDPEDKLQIPPGRDMIYNNKYHNYGPTMPTIQGQRGDSPDGRMDRVDLYFESHQNLIMAKKRGRDVCQPYLASQQGAEEAIPYKSWIGPGEHIKERLAVESLPQLKRESLTPPRLVDLRIANHDSTEDFDDEDQAISRPQGYNTKRILVRDRMDQRSLQSSEPRHSFRKESPTLLGYPWRKVAEASSKPSDEPLTEWPSWLHPGLCWETDDICPRPSTAELEMLFRAVEQYDHTQYTYEQLFRCVFGPFVCRGKEEEMYETVQAIGKYTGNRRLADLVSSRERSRSGPATTLLLSMDLFMERFLGSFPTFASFQHRDAQLQRAFSEELYDKLNTRMVWWYGGDHNEVDDYQMWATARLLHLDKDFDRVMSPDDLHPRVRQEWIHRLEQCETMEEAETLSEEYFGPLRKVASFKTAEINLGELWNPCACSICHRSRKRRRM